MPPDDVCGQCGDYRHQHDERGCKICRHGRAPWDKCSGFVEPASPDGKSERPPESAEPSSASEKQPPEGAE